MFFLGIWTKCSKSDVQICLIFLLVSISNEGALETAKMIFINLLMMEIDSVISKQHMEMLDVNRQNR